MQESEILYGTVHKFIYQNQENGFGIFILVPKRKLYGNDKITVKGFVPNVQIGQEVEIQGSWIFNKKFGKQFEAKSCTTALPTTVVGLKKYLSSGLIKGIGPKYAENLVGHFGSDVLDIINTNPDRLLEVDGIGQKRVEIIKEAWKEQKEIANIMVFLQDKNISTAFAIKIYKKYKQESIVVLKQNPYKLSEDIWGVGFKTADSIAQKMGFEVDSPYRISAGILYVISLASQSGHLYIELEELKQKTLKVLELDLQNHKSLVKKALYDLYEQDKIKFITYQANQLDQTFITLTSFYFSERNVSQKVKLLSEIPTKYNFDIDNIYNNLKQDNLIQLNEEQQQGILEALQNKISIVTGGPGTGKTTLIKKLLSILDDYNLNYKLAAPTGRAAKRIIEGTGKFATTLHRLLDFDPSTMNFVHNERNALKLDFLIIDEASMIDIFLANSVLKAIPQDAHVVFIGDINQLPSVGAGNFLNDLIQSDIISCTKLKKIFRQAQDSMIVVNAHRINEGLYPIKPIENSKNDFIFIKEENPENLELHLKKILFIKLKQLNIKLDDSIVLTPMNRGAAGAISLNHLLQNILNSNSDLNSQVSFGGTSYKVGDKVMQIRNNYDKKVYNGDIGVIELINKTDKELVVDFGNFRVNYDFDELNELVLAYAISIHKSQGSEYSAVIIPLFMQHFMLLQRNLVYTGLTRAKKLCIFIGEPKALAMAVKNTKGTKRVTFLDKFLTNQV